MSDLIDRDAAIDKVDRIVKVNHLKPDMVWFTPNGVKTLMEDLPSAEPDVTEEEVKEYCRKRCLCIVDSVLLKKYAYTQPEIIRCKDCKYMTEHYDTDGNAPYWACSEWDSGTDYDGFCHYAERREE